MPSSSSRGGTPRPRRASSPSAPRPGSTTRRGEARRSTRRPAPAPAPAAATGATSGVSAASQETPGWPVHRWWVLGIIAVALAIMIVPTIRRYADQQAQIAALREHIATQKAAVDHLAQDRARWDDPAYIEQQARERLHFVKAGETGYTVSRREQPAAASTDPQVVGVDAAADSLPWYGKVWGSLESADRLGGQVVRTPVPAPPGTSTGTGAPATTAPAISDTAPVPTSTTRSRR